MAEIRPRKAVGTYGARDILRSRGASGIFRDLLHWQPLIGELPGQDASQADVEAFREGEPLIVSCYLRGTFRPYPKRLTYGTLLISAHSAKWTPFIRLPWRRELRIDFRSPFIRTRPPGIRELLTVGNTQKPLDGVMVTQWTVVTARNSADALDFVIPTPDVPLVSEWLGHNAGTGYSTVLR